MATSDFQLNTLPTGGSLCRSMGTPMAFPGIGGTGRGYEDSGAIQSGIGVVTPT